MNAPTPRRKFATYMLLLLAIAFLAIALLRAWGVVQDLERNDARAASGSRSG